MNGWEILCCAGGASGNVCSPPTASDYLVTCEALFSGLTTGDNCDCRSLCSGTVVMNDSFNVFCEGSCICSGVCCDDGATCTNAPTPSPTSQSGNAMLCQSGWQTLYKEVSGSWEILCCAEGVSSGACFPVNANDYSVTCSELYNLAPGSTCNCGTLCNGTVLQNGTCSGACSCEGICCTDGAPCTIPYTGESGQGLSLSMGLIFGGLGILVVGGVFYSVFISSSSSVTQPVQRVGRGRYNVI